jgi:hypothetical protein
LRNNSPPTARATYKREEFSVSATLNALNYLYRWDHDLSFEEVGGLAFEGLLRRCRLDYSGASLARIDVFLDTLRKTKKIDPDTFWETQANQNLLFLLAFYVGEILSRCVGSPIEWYLFEKAAGIDPNVRKLGEGIHSSLLCRFPPESKHGTDWHAPLSTLIERLVADEPTKSIASTADIMLLPLSALLAAPLPPGHPSRRCITTHAGPFLCVPPGPLPPLPPQSMIDVSARLAECTQEEVDAMATARPSWLDEHGYGFAPWFDHADALFASGRVVWGALVHANKLLFEPNVHSAPGEVLYDPEGRVPPDGLESVAHALFSAKSMAEAGFGSSLLQKNIARYAAHLADEISRVFGETIQATAYPLKASTTYFDRHLLPDGMLTLGRFPLLVSDEHPGFVRILPARLWPAELREQWMTTSEAHFGVRHTPQSILASRECELGKQCLSNGDLTQAEQWLRQSADLGNTEARTLLAEHGMDGSKTGLKSKKFWQRWFGSKS